MPTPTGRQSSWHSLGAGELFVPTIGLRPRRVAKHRCRKSGCMDFERPRSRRCRWSKQWSRKSTWSCSFSSQHKGSFFGFGTPHHTDLKMRSQANALKKPTTAVRAQEPFGAWNPSVRIKSATTKAGTIRNAHEYATSSISTPSAGSGSSNSPRPSSFIVLAVACGVERARYDA